MIPKNKFNVLRTDSSKCGAVPVVVMLVAAAFALFATGTLVGFLLSKKTQGFLLFIGVIFLVVFALLNVAGIIRWWKGIRKEIEK